MTTQEWRVDGMYRNSLYVHAASARKAVDFCAASMMESGSKWVVRRWGTDKYGNPFVVAERRVEDKS